VFGPCATPEYDFGLEQLVKSAWFVLFVEQRNVTPASPVNEKLALVVVVQPGSCGGPFAIDGAAGGVVSNVYAWPANGGVPPSAFPAPSTIGLLTVRLSWIEPLFEPLVPVALAVTVHVADGAPPTATAVAIVGAFPPSPLVARPKFPVPTPVTGSLKVTVQWSGPAFAGFGSVLLRDETVGAVRSIAQV